MGYVGEFEHKDCQKTSFSNTILLQGHWYNTTNRKASRDLLSSRLSVCEHFIEKCYFLQDLFSVLFLREVKKITQVTLFNILAKLRVFKLQFMLLIFIHMYFNL